jgi:Ca2+-binding RTX toxin-like protein
LQSGADIFTAATTVTAPLSVFGGAGADTITSGAGNDRLSGGLGDDTLVLDTDTQLGSDIVDDAGGNDWLDFSGTTTVSLLVDIGSTLTQTVNANLRLTLMGAALIDAVAGGTGADTIRGNALANILLGNAGNDSLLGFAGNDLLIGGAGADSLSGGAGDDILIGGSTTYDSQRTALQAILAEWLGPETYDVKAGRIRRGEARFPLVARSTVINDNSVDQLLGEDGQDWFWLSSGETLRDRLTTELIDTV